MDVPTTVTFLAVAVVPLAYLAFCWHLRRSQVPRPPYLVFLILFAIPVDWAMLFSRNSLFPVGASIFFFASPFVLVFRCFRLINLPERTRYHWGAIVLGFVYAGLLAFLNYFFALYLCLLAYVLFCRQMWRADLTNTPYVTYFFIFLIPSFWALLPYLGQVSVGYLGACIFLLNLLGPIVLFISAINLSRSSDCTIYHRCAKWLGFTYPSLFVSLILALILLRHR